MGLRASGEDYLEAILVLQKQKGVVRSVDVARHLWSDTLKPHTQGDIIKHRKGVADGTEIRRGI